MVLGIWLALVGALVLAVADACKKMLSVRYSSEVLIWNTASWGALLGAIFFLVAGFPAVPWKLISPYLALGIALFVFGEITFIRSLKSGEFSEVIPFKAAVPIFALLFSYLLLSEVPSGLAFVGVLFVVAGIYLMYLPSFTVRALLQPFSSAWNSPGPRYMVLSSAAAAGLGVTIKFASESVSALFFFWLVLVGEVLWFSIVLLRKRLSPIRIYREAPREVLIMALPWSIGIVLLNVSVSYTLVAYAHAAGQVHAVASFILAYYLFGEAGVARRVPPALVMLLGVCLILLG